MEDNTLNKKEEEEIELFRLDDLDDFEVPDDDPDIRGWDVIVEGGEKVGRVDELIVDFKKLKENFLSFKDNLPKDVLVRSHPNINE